MKPFTIVVDTSCDLPQEYMKEHNIQILPIPFFLDDKVYETGYWQDISDHDFYQALRNGSIARTSQINPYAFIEAFTEYAKQELDALFIILSGGLTASYQSSLLALEEVKESYPNCNLHPVDSIGAASINGLLAMMAVQKRAEGLSAREAAAWLEKKKHSCFALFTVDDLMYLHRGGRLSKISAVAGSILGIKPILNIAPDGTLGLKDKVRGRKATFEFMVNQLKKTIDPTTSLDTVMINHTDCYDDARTLAGILEAAIDVRQIIILMMGPVIGAHLGPGAITMFFETDVITREEYENKFYSKK